jgi:hypothetical protein
MGNRWHEPGDNRAAPQSDFEINNSKKVPKRRKYEGKWLRESCSVSSSRNSHALAVNRSVEGLSLLFILAVRSFSNMFTTYSHMFCSCPRQLA